MSSVRNVIDYLKNAAKEYPNKIAFVDEKNSLTFSEIDRSARKIATAINNTCGVGRNRPIAVYMPKSVDVLVAFLGIAYSGNFYSPIDVKMPLSRVDNILKTLEPVAIIQHTNKVLSTGYDVEEIYYEEAMEIESSDNLDVNLNKVLDIDPLYVFFTSGSTGIPKGVTISHRGVIDYAEWLKNTFDFNEKTVFGNQAPFYFDNSILDIYSTLKNGSTMFIIPEHLFTFPRKVLEYLREKDINTIFWVPSALIGVANSGMLKDIKLSSLKKVLFCGEVMPNKQLNMWREEYPELLYANLYGPTEITDVCTYYIVNREFGDDESLPIGIPCENMDVIVLNDQDELISEGESGELCVRGIGVSMGYYANAEKTRDGFVQNPLNKNYHEWIYRTGDIVKYNEYGELIYLSRKDFQIKHQGNRIELGEIEVAASACEGVDANCVLYDTANSKIVLFYVSKNGVSEKEVYRELKNRIPAYMLPGKIHVLDDFPLNLNGKIDRIKLKTNYIDNYEDE